MHLEINECPLHPEMPRGEKESSQIQEKAFDQQMSETIPVSAGEASAVLSQPGQGTGGDALAGAARS